MQRVFLGLACGMLLVLIAAAGVGLLSRGERPDSHIVLAVFALIVACLIQVVVFTYLTVTGKLVTQALHLAKADLSPLKAVKGLKLEATYLVGLMILATVPVVAAGAHTWRTDSGQRLHLVLALVSIVCHGYVLLREFDLIARNGRLVTRVLNEYGIAGAEDESTTPTVRGGAAGE